MNKAASLMRFAALFTCFLAHASQPERLHDQGYLTNIEGEAVHCSHALSCPGQVVNTTFRLYDETEGVPLVSSPACICR